MIFNACRLKGVFLIEHKPVEDERGYFCRVFCREQMESNGLIGSFVQWNHSYSKRRGTLRGLHYSYHRMLRQSICDALPEHLRCCRRPTQRFAYFSPMGVLSFASEGPLGFVRPQRLRARSSITRGRDRVLYAGSAMFSPTSEGRVKFDDPRVRIEWPIENPILSPKDSSTQCWQTTSMGLICDSGIL